MSSHDHDRVDALCQNPQGSNPQTLAGLPHQAEVHPDKMFPCIFRMHAACEEFAGTHDRIDSHAFNETKMLQCA